MAAYGNLCTAFYDLDKPSAPADALAFYVERARSAGGRVLEPMCGSGRFLLPMAHAGLQIDGIDSSPEMLAACRARAHQLGIPVNVHLQDLTALALPHQYTLAFIPAGSIGLITEDQDLRQVLSRIHAHLVPNGTLLLELVDDTTESLSPRAYAPRSVECGDGSSITYTCSTSRTTSPDTIRYSGTYTKHQGSRVIETETEALSLRLHDVERLSAVLASCGFTITKVSDASELPFLAAGGCTLLEARAAASQHAPAIDLVRLFGFLGGAPGTLVALTLLPWTIHVAAGEFQDDPLFSGLSFALFAGTIFTISSYWHLVVRTAQGRACRLGLIFKLAIAVASVLTFGLLVFLPAMAVVTALPASLATVFLVRTQLRFPRASADGLQQVGNPTAR